jgi:hypothetical protein
VGHVIWRRGAQLLCYIADEQYNPVSLGPSNPCSPQEESERTA